MLIRPRHVVHRQTIGWLPATCIKIPQCARPAQVWGQLRELLRCALARLRRLQTLSALHDRLQQGLSRQYFSFPRDDVTPPRRPSGRSLVQQKSRISRYFLSLSFMTRIPCRVTGCAAMPASPIGRHVSNLYLELHQPVHGLVFGVAARICITIPQYALGGASG